jgi:hypothetical protein
MSGFEATSWEWETDRGFYQIDRFGLGYDAEYRPSRNHMDRWPIEPSDDHTAGRLEWETVDDAMRACRLHYELLATMTPSRACTEIAQHPELVARRRPTLRGLSPVVQLLPPKGAFL